MSLCAKSSLAQMFRPHFTHVRHFSISPARLLAGDQYETFVRFRCRLWRKEAVALASRMPAQRQRRYRDTRTRRFAGDISPRTSSYRIPASKESGGFSRFPGQRPACSRRIFYRDRGMSAPLSAPANASAAEISMANRMLSASDFLRMISVTRRSSL